MVSGYKVQVEKGSGTSAMPRAKRVAARRTDRSQAPTAKRLKSRKLLRCIRRNGEFGKGGTDGHEQSGNFDRCLGGDVGIRRFR
jgi:hypothetical protein